jgi:prophage regulatory protein
MREPEVLAATGLSQSTIRRYVLAGIFPPIVRIGIKAKGWERAKVNRWLADRSAGRPLEPQDW